METKVYNYSLLLNNNVTLKELWNLQNIKSIYSTIINIRLAHIYTKKRDISKVINKYNHIIEKNFYNQEILELIQILIIKNKFYHNLINYYDTIFILQTYTNYSLILKKIGVLFLTLLTEDISENSILMKDQFNIILSDYYNVIKLINLSHFLFL